MSDDPTELPGDLTDATPSVAEHLRTLVNREMAQAMAPLEERIAELERRVKALELTI
jgi:hypothetical protein